MVVRIRPCCANDPRHPRLLSLIQVFNSRVLSFFFFSFFFFLHIVAKMTNDLYTKEYKRSKTSIVRDFRLFSIPFLPSFLPFFYFFFFFFFYIIPYNFVLFSLLFLSFSLFLFLSFFSSYYTITFLDAIYL